MLGHVGLGAYHDAMLLTDAQRRTLGRLIGTADRPVFAADLRQRLVDRIEERRGARAREPLWLGKEALNQLARCEGRFAARLEGEDHRSSIPSTPRPGSSSTRPSRWTSDPRRAGTACDRRHRGRPAGRAGRAVRRVLAGTHGPEQDELLMEVVRKVTLFQGRSLRCASSAARWRRSRSCR